MFSGYQLAKVSAPSDIQAVINYGIFIAIVIGRIIKWQKVLFVGEIIYKERFDRKITKFYN